MSAVAIQTLETMRVTRSALTQLKTPALNQLLRRQPASGAQLVNGT
jgi:hypothetical protein